jgi:copper(I)-binding protein
MFTTLCRAALAAGLSILALPVLADGIEVHDAYAIQAMPGGPTAAAFMVIHNHGGAPDRLIAARSDIAARTELHTHRDDGNGVMQMIEVTEGFDLPTDGEILMQRGGHHVMFLGVGEALTDGQVIPVTLVFETAGDIVVDVVVDLDRAAEGHMQHGDMEHGAEGHGAMDHGSGGHGHGGHGDASE